LSIACFISGLILGLSSFTGTPLLTLRFTFPAVAS
jgi:hypothetical protein